MADPNCIETAVASLASCCFESNNKFWTVSRLAVIKEEVYCKAFCKWDTQNQVGVMQWYWSFSLYYHYDWYGSPATKNSKTGL